MAKVVVVVLVVLALTAIAWAINPGSGILVFALGCYGCNGVISKG